MGNLTGIWQEFFGPQDKGSKISGKFGAFFVGNFVA